MKCVEIGNCLENGNASGIIIEATPEELSDIKENILYHDVKVVLSDESK